MSVNQTLELSKIWVRPINDPPTFTVQVVELQTEASNSEELESRPYSFLFSDISDPDFYNLEMKLTITASFGYFYLDKNATGCVINLNQIICEDLRLNLLHKWGPLILFDPEWFLAPNDPPSSESNVTCSRTFTIDLNDLANVDYRKPLNALNHTQEINVTKDFLQADNALVTSKASSSNTVSIAVGAGVAAAVVAAVIAAIATRKNKSNVDQYLAEFLSQENTAGQTVSPLYHAATKKFQSPLFAAGADS